MADDPLRVDWLPSRLLGGDGSGRLGLTVLPGKRGASLRYPGRVYRRELDADLASLRAAGVVRLVLLVEDGELDRFGTPGRPPSAWTPRVSRFPMPDGAAPPDPAAMDRILDVIEEALASGDVAVACMGGVGRSGTVAACALVRHGLPAGEAIGVVRAVRHPTAVETPEQEAFVRAYARHRSEG